MQTAVEYMNKTESALRKLFEGIDSYIEIMRKHPEPSFVTSCADEEEREKQRESWLNENQEANTTAFQAHRDFVAESFAQATLCGAVLQVAAKIVECYSKNTVIPVQWELVIKQGTKAVPFCIGRPVRDIPLGLIIYAARNQHMHFDDEDLREPNLSIFERLATNHGYSSDTPFRDPTFDLKNPLVQSYSSNVITLVKWHSYEAYEKDIRALLAI